ncbi:MAG TPA: hypothetical protein VN428_02420 [Bryobacteraceae bacterium]|nr:hypothetical protein [Bryobacteraceae bacterium]
MAFLNIPYTQDSIRRAVRGITPPFLPEGYGYDAAPIEPAQPPPLSRPQPVAPPEPPPIETPAEIARYRELAGRGAPQHPKHGKLRTALETVGKVYGVNEEITDPGYSRERDQYYSDLQAAKMGADAAEADQKLRAELEMRRKQTAAAEATRAREERLMNAPPKAERQVIDGQLFELDASTGKWAAVAGAPKPREIKPGYGYEKDGKVEIPVPTPPKLSTPIPGRDVPFPKDVEEQKRRMAAANRAPSGPARGTPKQFADLDKNKSADLLRLKQWASDQAYNNPDSANSTYADLRNAYQEVQNDYERQIASLGGNVEHFEYPAGPEFIAQQTGVKPKPPAPKTGGAAATSSKYKLGDTVRLRSGKTVRITSVNSDGTFDYE